MRLAITSETKPPHQARDRRRICAVWRVIGGRSAFFYREEAQYGSPSRTATRHTGYSSRRLSERVALSITAALRGPELSALQDLLRRAQTRATDLLMAMPPHLPSREEMLNEARTMFARTRSLDEIVDRAYELFIAAVYRTAQSRPPQLVNVSGPSASFTGFRWLRVGCAPALKDGGGYAR